jgi:hypothetical protein
MKAASRSRTEWAKLVKKLGESDSSALDFATRHGVNARTLTWWRSWFRRQAASSAWATPLRRSPTSASTDRGIRLVQVALSPRSPVSSWDGDVPDVTVDIGRARVSVRRGVDISTLAAVLAALGIEGAR